MRKLKNVIYNKLVLQAEEAKELNMVKLADGVISAVGSISREDDEKIEFSLKDLENEIYNQLWKVTASIIDYYDLESADITKLNVEGLAEKVLDQIKSDLSIQKTFGPNEPKIIGEK